MSISSNRKLEETSFLSKSNSSFIEQMYLKYLNKDFDLPESFITSKAEAKELNHDNKNVFKLDEIENISVLVKKAEAKSYQSSTEIS